MDFKLTEEQRMLADLVTRFVEKDCGFEQRRAAVAAPEGFSRANWATLAETGLLGLNVPEAHGGLGGTPADTLVVMQALGPALAVEPYVTHAVVMPRLLAAAGSPQQQAAHFPALVAGHTLYALAVLEAGGGYDTTHVTTRAERSDSGWTLNGAKAVVLHGDSADVLVVSARTAGAPGQAEGVSLFLVQRSAPGVACQAFRTFDGQHVAEVTLADVAVPAAALLGSAGQGHAVLEQALDHGRAALCAEAAGAMQRLIELTTEYLRTRKQFGQPIGAFQALQHRAADMVIQQEQSLAMAYAAAAALDATDATERRRGVAAAKSLVGRCGRLLGQAATQLHGGMGMTDEMLCGHYFKRLVAIDKTWGDSDHQAAVFAALMD